MNPNGEIMVTIFKVKELKNDFIGSVILGSLLVAVIYFLDLSFIYSNILGSLGTVLTISITLAGFLTTSLTILFVFPENNRIRFIRLHQTYKYIFHAFIVSISLFVVLAILSFIFKILMPYVPAILVFSLIILFIWATISLFRCLWLLKKMIDVYFDKPEEVQNENP